jgi:predicted anti-sigma-YlaC factor YlaD
MESHLSTCNDCQIWQRQITDIIAEAAHIPQFDVPEALTQRIMTRVTEESVKQESSWTTVIMAAAAVIALAILTVSGFESTNGLASWGLGLIAMGGLAWLVTDTKKETLVSKRS